MCIGPKPAMNTLPLIPNWTWKLPQCLLFDRRHYSECCWNVSCAVVGSDERQIKIIPAGLEGLADMRYVYGVSCVGQAAWVSSGALRRYKAEEE